MEPIDEVKDLEVIAEHNTVLKPNGLKLIIESPLSVEQQQIATQIYEKIKSDTILIISDSELNTSLKIIKIISCIIKQLELIYINKNKLSGLDKKQIAILLGRILIKEVTPDDKGEPEILLIYDTIAESTLEAMIDVSKVVNVVITEMATKCCPNILEIFRKVKHNS